MSRYQKGKTNLDFTEARDSGWQWHQLDHMPVCTLLQTDNHASTPPLSFLRAGCPYCRSTNSVKALKGLYWDCILDYHTQNEESHVATYQSVNWSRIRRAVGYCEHSALYGQLPVTERQC